MKCTIRPMRAFELGDVRRVLVACEASQLDRPYEWFVAHPTLVLWDNGDLFGWTAFSVGLAPGCHHAPPDGEVMYGHGVYVQPTVRRRGYGRALAEARYAIARRLGITTFIGMTQPDNAAMIRILEGQGCKPIGTAVGAHPDGSDGVMYVGAISMKEAS